MGNPLSKAVYKALGIRPGWSTVNDMLTFEKYLPKDKKDATLLEIGTATGRMTVFMANRCPQAEIYTIDNFTAPSLGSGKEKKRCRYVIERNLRKYPNIHFIEGDSRTVPWDKKIDFLFIDGNHLYEFVKSDFERFSPFIKKGGYVLFHDWKVNRKKVQVGQYIRDKKLKVVYEDNIAIWQKKK